MDAMYDKASDIAEKYLALALEEAGAMGYLTAVMMVEAAVNAAVETTSHEDVVRLLKDLMAQIEADIED
ncbi:MAG TPA: hypothetical protein VNT30_06700 [Stellaceae bacterium]|nr:hypothetical protein [Stellaceae bacterium]